MLVLVANMLSDCRYNVEPDSSQPDLPEHHLVLQDFVLEKPRAGEANICRRRYDRTGDIGSKRSDMCLLRYFGSRAPVAVH